MLLLIIASAFWDKKGDISLGKKKYECQSTVIDIFGDSEVVEMSAGERYLNTLK